VIGTLTSCQELTGCTGNLGFETILAAQKFFMPTDQKAEPDLPPEPPAETTAVVEHRIRRLSWSMVSDALMGTFNAERGFWFTMRGFVRNPQAAFAGYVGKARFRYSNPLKMVIFLSALTAVAVHQLHAAGWLEPRPGAEETPDGAALAAFMRRNYNLLLLCCLPVMAGASRLFYWGRAYNFLEHLALNSFQVSVITLAYLVMLPLVILWPSATLVYLVLALAYQAWLYRKVLGPNWFRAIIATLGVNAAYMVTMGWLGSVFFELM
jgi:hypothetical protein